VGCGKKRERKRIVGGFQTEVNEYPWMALLRDKFWSEERFVCAGSLISAEWVLTAAHCLTFFTTANLEVRLGEHQRSSATETSLTVSIGVDKIVEHPGYDNPKNDVALLKLASRVDTTIYTPVCLPLQAAVYTGFMATVIGWGKTTAAKEGRAGSSDVLLEATDLPIISDTDCVAAGVEVEWKISPDMVCAGGEVGKDSCKGDSGGPLMISSVQECTLVGVVSWGLGCAREGLPGVYAEVSYFRTWIDKVVAS